MIIESTPLPDIQRKFNRSQRRELARIARVNQAIGARTIVVQPGDNIQAAIDKLDNSGGGIVFLKQGTHTLTGNISGRDKVSIIGEGIGVSIIECGGNAYGISYVGTVGSRFTNFKLQDFTIQNSNNTAAVDIDFCDYYKIDSIKTTSCDQSGIRIDASRWYMLNNIQSDNNTGNGFVFIGSNGASGPTQYFSVINCFSQSNTADGFNINGDGVVSEGLYLGCRSDTNTGDGFDLSGSSSLKSTFLNCSSINNSQNGFRIDCVDSLFVGCDAAQNTTSGFLITSARNTFLGCGAGDDGADYDVSGTVGEANIFIGNIFGSSTATPHSEFSLPTGATNPDVTISVANLFSSTRTEKQQAKMKNTSGGTLALGNVIIIKSAAGGDEVTTTTTAGDDKVFGVVAQAVSNNSYGTITTVGHTTVLTVNGTTDIAIGDLLSTYTEAGIAAKAAAGDMCFAIALEAYTTNDSNGVIDALIISPRLI